MAIKKDMENRNDIEKFVVEFYENVKKFRADILWVLPTELRSVIWSWVVSHHT